MAHDLYTVKDGFLALDDVSFGKADTPVDTYMAHINNECEDLWEQLFRTLRPKAAFSESEKNQLKKKIVGSLGHFYSDIRAISRSSKDQVSLDSTIKAIETLIRSVATDKELLEDKDIAYLHENVSYTSYQRALKIGEALQLYWRDREPRGVDASGIFPDRYEDKQQAYLQTLKELLAIAKYAIPTKTKSVTASQQANEIHCRLIDFSINLLSHLGVHLQAPNEHVYRVYQHLTPLLGVKPLEDPRRSYKRLSRKEN